MIIEFEEKLLELIDARIENASDDELFAGLTSRCPTV
ncbi:YfcL family protein, partial [Vibrio parahaemolyticus]